MKIIKWKILPYCQNEDVVAAAAVVAVPEVEVGTVPRVVESAMTLRTMRKTPIDTVVDLGRVQAEIQEVELDYRRKEKSMAIIPMIMKT